MVPVAAAEHRVRPVQVWSAVGAAFLLLEAYVIIAWLASGNATPTPTGPTPVPTWMKIAIHGTEVAGVVALVGFGYVLLVRPWRRDRAVTWDGRMMLALMSLYFLHDPLANYLVPWFTFNAEFVNFGSWASNVPGWVSPNGHLLADPVIFNITSFGYMFLGLILVGNALVARWHGRKSRSPAQVVLATLGLFTAFILIVEPFFMLLGFWSYPGAVASLTINYGRYYQYPVYEGFLLGACWGTLALLRYFRDDKGESWAERGVSTLGAPGRRRGWIRFLALVGFCHTVFLAYFGSLQIFAVHASPWPADIVNRSYLTNGLCGPGTDYACPGPGVPINRRDSVHLRPDGTVAPG